MLRAEFIFKPIRRNACPLIERNERAQQHDSDVGCVPKNWLKVGWDETGVRSNDACLRFSGIQE